MNKNTLENRVYNAIILLDTGGKKISIRQIAKILGKQNSLYSIQKSLKLLIYEGKVVKNDKGKIEMNLINNNRIMNNKEIFLQAINNKEIVKIKVDSKSKGIITRHCIPFDFGKSKRKGIEFGEEKFHFWDLDSPEKIHNLPVFPEKLLEIELTNKTFEPGDYVKWTPSWNIVRDWGIYS